jgi:hypothetical protein
VKLNGPGLPGFPDPAGPVKRNPALSGEMPLAAGESGPVAAGKIPSTADRAKPPGFNLKQLVHSLRLPQDGLSTSLIGFARFFSLPLEPAFLARLRKEALTLKARHGGGFAESAALAAAAAAGKGVRLSAEALEQYVRAIDPGYAAGKQDTPGDGEGQSTGGGDALSGERDGDAQGDSPDSGGREESARIIREILEKALKRAGQGGRPDPDLPETGPGPACAELTGFLNRLPGRDGNFWMVFPFKINSKDLAIRLSVWILLVNGICFKEKSAGQIGGNSVGRITINAVGEKRRWGFSIENPGGPGARTRVLVSPPYGEAGRKKTGEEIREVLGDFGGTVTLEDGKTSTTPGIHDEDAFFTWPMFFADTGGFSPLEEEA